MKLHDIDDDGYDVAQTVDALDQVLFGVGDGQEDAGLDGLGALGIFGGRRYRRQRDHYREVAAQRYHQLAHYRQLAAERYAQLAHYRRLAQERYAHIVHYRGLAAAANARAARFDRLMEWLIAAIDAEAAERDPPAFPEELRDALRGRDL